MKCPRCGSETRVLETREREADLTLRRRRHCTAAACGFRFWAVEMSESAFGSKPRRETLRHAAACRKRWDQLARDLAIATELHKGWQPLAQRYALNRTAVYVAAARGRRWLRRGC